MGILTTIVLVLAGILCLIFLLQLFNKKTTGSAIQSTDKYTSQAKYGREIKSSYRSYNVDLSSQHQIFFSFGEQGLIEANQRYGLLAATDGSAPYNNRYTQYYLDFGDLASDATLENPLPVIIQLKHVQLEFLRSTDVYFERCDDQLICCGLDDQWTDQDASLEQAYDDFKKNVEKLYSVGAKNYYEMDSVRYDKTDYLKVLKEEGVLIAPEYLNFDEFKIQLETEDIAEINMLLYVDEVVISLNYSKNFRAEVEVSFRQDIERHLTYFSANDVELAQLSEHEKRIKFVAQVEKELEVRRELEHQARLDGFKIDESYKDPYIDL